MALSSSSSSRANANSVVVAERRLRPIYDWLDNGNNKKALQEADKVLKKQADFQCCKVLKSLALLRMGREAEARTLLEAVLREGPTDEGALQAMSIAYRELQQLDKICTMYEVATRKEPNNEELLSHLFMSYVRMGYYKKQQQAAMALYKARPKNPYYFWAIMSIILHAINDDDEKVALNVSLPLAERMIVKMEKEKKMDQEQETHLYLMVLELQHKFKEALDVIEGPLGVKLNEQTSYLNFVAYKKIYYLKKIGRWKEVNNLTKEVLIKSPDQWNLYLDYITSVFQISDEKEEEDKKSSEVELAREFILKQQENNPKCRGPYLAQMELLSRQIARRDCSDDETESMMSLLLNYFRRFGSKPCCFFDIKLYLPALDKETQIAEFFQKVHSVIQCDEQGVPLSVEDIGRHVCLYQMRRFVGDYPKSSILEAERLVADLTGFYENAQGLVVEYQYTELRPSDMYLVLAAHILWDLWNETKAEKYFWKAVLLLEHALKLSMFNYHIRFLLIKFYNQAGAVGVSEEIHAGLALKHIQLDSLGYLISRHILTCGHFDAASKIFGNTLKFFTGNYKDTVDHIISAYRCGSFDKIREFIKLRDRLSSSQHYTSLTLERMLLDLLVETSTHGQTVQMMSYLEIEPDKDEITWSDLHDNRDFKSMVSFDSPEKAVTDDLISDNFVQEQKFLRFRSLIMRSLAASVYMSEDIHPARRSGGTGSSKSTAAAAAAATTTAENNGIDDERRGSRMAKVIEDLVDQLNLHLKKCSNLPKPQQQYPIQGPNRPRILLYLNHAEYFVSLLRLVLSVQSIVVNKQHHHHHHPQQQQQQQPQLNKDFLDFPLKISNDFAAMVNDHIRSVTSAAAAAADGSDSILDRDRHFEVTINIIESSSFTGIICGVCRSLLKANISQGRKSKKKKEINPDIEKFTSAFNSMLSGLDESLRSLLDFVECWREKVTKKEEEDGGGTTSEKKIEDLLSELNVDDKTGFSTALTETDKNVRKRLVSSYQTSFDHVKTVIQNKLNYLNFLKL